MVTFLPAGEHRILSPIISGDSDQPHSVFIPWYSFTRCLLQRIFLSPVEKQNNSPTPENKYNLGLRAKFAKWSANATLHYVDEFYEIYLTSNPVFGRVGAGPTKVKSYTTLNARIAYNITENIELSVAAYNLFRNKHYESNPPDLDAGNWHTADLIDRRITAGVSCKIQ